MASWGILVWNKPQSHIGELSQLSQRMPSIYHHIPSGLLYPDTMPSTLRFFVKEWDLNPHGLEEERNSFFFLGGAWRAWRWNCFSNLRQGSNGFAAVECCNLCAWARNICKKVGGIRSHTWETNTSSQSSPIKTNKKMYGHNPWRT